MAEPGYVRPHGSGHRGLGRPRVDLERRAPDRLRVAHRVHRVELHVVGPVRIHADRLTRVRLEGRVRSYPVVRACDAPEIVRSREHHVEGPVPRCVDVRARHRRSVVGRVDPEGDRMGLLSVPGVTSTRRYSSWWSVVPRPRRPRSARTRPASPSRRSSVDARAGRRQEAQAVAAVPPGRRDDRRSRGTSGRCGPDRTSDTSALPQASTDQ